MVYAEIKHKVYQHAEVWLNAYVPIQTRTQYETAGNPNWEAAAGALCFKIDSHEWGHVWGLNDDLSFTVPGLMVRKAMLDHLNEYELATLEWLYD